MRAGRRRDPVGHLVENIQLVGVHRVIGLVGAGKVAHHKGRVLCQRDFRNGPPFVPFHSKPVHAGIKMDRCIQACAVMEGFMINFYDVPACFTVGEVSYDLQNGRYSVQGLMNQEPQIDFNGLFTEDDFNPNALRRGGIR